MPISDFGVFIQDGTFLLAMNVPLGYISAMNLKTYISQNNLTLAEFGARVGVSHASVSRWVNGERTPSLGTALAIEKATKGKVKPSDWFEPAEAKGAA